MSECFSMVREEKVIKANTLGQIVMLLSKRQLERFSAVVAWYQIHNNLYYFLDEREAVYLFIDLFIGKRLLNKTISERRSIVLNHLEIYLREDKEKYLIELAKGAAERKSVKELKEIADKVKNDEVY